MKGSDVKLAGGEGAGKQEGGVVLSPSVGRSRHRERGQSPAPSVCARQLSEDMGSRLLIFVFQVELTLGAVLGAWRRGDPVS